MNENIIYLDNAATTKPSDRAAAAYMKIVETFGNPSSLHGLGLAAEKLLEQARKTVAQRLGADAKGLLFTSGGTEANNTAVFGAARARKKLGTRVITSRIEHPSVLEAFRQLENEGFGVVYVDAVNDGRIDMDQLRAALDENTTFVSVMHVNNETGVMQPLGEIRAAINEKAPKAVFHSDCVQSFGKVDIPVSCVDMVTVSAHKIHGFKGCGAFYVKDFRMIHPLLHGGGQQRAMRPGTENIGGILAFAAAAEEIGADNSYLVSLRNRMKDALLTMPNTRFNGSDEHNSGSVLNVSFGGIRSEILLHALEARGVYISSGSACSSHQPRPSHVLTAMGLSKKEIDGSVRISFDRTTTADEIDKAAEIIREEVQNIRRYIR